MFLDIKNPYFLFELPIFTLSEFDFKKLVLLSRKHPQKFQKSNFLNIKMVKIDPKSFEIKSLKISASQVSHNKRYSNLKNRGGGRFVPPPVMSRVKIEMGIKSE